MTGAPLILNPLKIKEKIYKGIIIDRWNVYQPSRGTAK
jgi:hypothetical protein